MFSSMGVAVHTLYCFCKKESKVSFFDIQHNCKDKHTPPSVSAPTEKTHSCCSKKKACHKPQTADNNTAKTTCNDRDCTKKEVKIVKAELVFLETEKQKFAEYTAFNPYFPTKNPIFLHFSDYVSQVTCAVQPSRPPPQYAGRDRLNFIQTYRC